MQKKKKKISNTYFVQVLSHVQFHAARYHSVHNTQTFSVPHCSPGEKPGETLTALMTSREQKGHGAHPPARRHSRRAGQLGREQQDKHTEVGTALGLPFFSSKSDHVKPFSGSSKRCQWQKYAFQILGVRNKEAQVQNALCLSWKNKLKS